MEGQLGYELHHAARALRGALDRALDDLQLTAPQHAALYLLDRAPGSTSADLARQAFVTAQTMHKIVIGLEERGLLAREGGPGRGRVQSARLTERGHRVLREAHARVRATEERMLTGLDELDRAHLFDLLRHCVGALERGALPSPVDPVRDGPPAR